MLGAVPRQRERLSSTHNAFGRLFQTEHRRRGESKANDVKFHPAWLGVLTNARTEMLSEDNLKELRHNLAHLSLPGGLGLL